MRTLIPIVVAAKMLMLLGIAAGAVGLLLTVLGVHAAWMAWWGLLLTVLALGTLLICSRLLQSHLRRAENDGVTTVYMPLLNQGADVLRPVTAMKITDLGYMVTEPAPVGEEWAFQPGHVLRCEERNVDGEARLVAVGKAT